MYYYTTKTYPLQYADFKLSYQGIYLRWIV